MKRRLDRRDIPYMAALCAVFALFVLNYVRLDYVYGSNLDWAAQHYAIPDYFRKLFYETGELFPSLALNLGGGENIYSVSYYGLYSPVILPSYLMPGVPMYLYIQVSTGLLVLAACLLFYRFERKRNDRLYSFVLALMFMTASPLILHSHRHVMFVSYMPFLVLCFEAIDAYLERGRKLRLSVLCFLIVMTSWFFSVAALAAVAVYAVYRYLEMDPELDFKLMIKTGAGIALRMLCGVMMAGVLLLPTLGALLGGREGTRVPIEPLSLVPTVKLEFLGFSAYSMGLGAFAVLAIVSGLLHGSRQRRFLSIVIGLLITCPVFIYLLNGTLYLDGKVLLPFMPLAVILCEELFRDARSRELTAKELLITGGAIVLGLICYLSGRLLPRCAFAAELVILAVFWKLYKKERNSKLLFLPALAVPVVLGWIVSTIDYRPLKSDIKKYNAPEIAELCENITDDNLWRSSNSSYRAYTVNNVYAINYYDPYIYSSVHNGYYNSFYFEEMNNENEFRNSALTTCSANPYFSVFMANRFTVTDSPDTPFGCTEIARSGDWRLLENDSAAAFGRCAPTLSEEFYDALPVQEKMEALCNYIIAGEGTDYETSVRYAYDIPMPEDSRITRSGENSRIKTLEKFSVDVELPEPLEEGKVLIIETEADNTVAKHCDARLTINGVRNTLTDAEWRYYNNNTDFTYVLAPKNGQPLTELHLTFSVGEYEIAPLRAYYADHPKAAEGAGQLKVDMSRTAGDVITGSIDCSDDSMFMLTLPYSKGYAITVDGNAQDYELVSKAFIGFPLTAGSHEIVVRFTAPLLPEGKLLSGAGSGLFALLGLFDVVMYARKRKADSE